MIRSGALPRAFPSLPRGRLRGALALAALGWSLIIGSASAAPTDWQEVDRRDGLVISTRERPGSSVKEVRAVGTIDVPNWVVKNVIDDAQHYTDFMPYTAESRVLSRDPERHTLVAYEKLTPPIVSPRDYTIRVYDEPRHAPDGTIIYQTRWEPDSEAGPPAKAGIVRVKNTEGSWVLEPMDGGAHTRATYTIYTDGGGGLPAFIINQANKRSIADLFSAVQKTAHQPKYRVNHPPGP
jgi:hypothetical protein